MYCAPVIKEEIRSGHAHITGNFSYEEAQLLAGLVWGARLPGNVRIESVVKKGQ
jgi:preprotein translocase subunit SecD